MSTSLESQFDFSKYTYEIAFEEKDTSFWERVFSSKEKKTVYYIRRLWKVHGDKHYHPEQVLHKDVRLDGHSYRFGRRDDVPYWYKVCYYKDISEPTELLQRLKYREKPTQINVAVSSDDL